MTELEIFRMACYVISTIAAGRLFLKSWHERMMPATLLFGSLTLLYVWYIIEITIASTGVNTREYRAIGTPMVMLVASALVWWSFRWTSVNK
ncbi:MAG: hypothetical protein KAX65_07555 [Caldilineaceae bacterium]|jgi:hypothetical protein|nr:hypothetical protein [Caldilineaceae bacterium]